MKHTDCGVEVAVGACEVPQTRQIEPKMMDCRVAWHSLGGATKPVMTQESFMHDRQAQVPKIGSKLSAPQRST
jgi:hypothetical protein